MNIKCNLHILILLILKIIKNSEIIIPFSSFLSENPKNLTPPDFMKSLLKNELYTNIQIGTPPQNIDIIIDFNNYHSYLIKDNKNDHKSYKRYYYNKSSTFRSSGHSDYFYFADFTHAMKSSDIITIKGQISNFNLTFLQVIYSNAQTKIQHPGIIGFGVVPNGEPFHKDAGLIYQLKANNLTNNSLYTLVFNNNNFNGKIVIEKNIYEEYSINDFKSDYTLTTLDYTFFWGWNFMNSKFNSKSLKIKNIYLKPELGVVLVHENIKKILKEKFFDEKIAEKKCYEGYYVYSFFYCDKDVRIDIGEFTFELKKVNLQFSLNSDDLILEYNDKIYFLMGFGNIPIEEAHLGYPFFRKYDVIFNQDSRHVGFYCFKIGKNKKEIKGDLPREKDDLLGNDEKEKNIVFKVILLCLLIISFVFLLYFIFYIYRKIKRKTKGKLIEEELNDIKNN